MDLGLKELGVTFLVGAIAILGWDLIYYVFRGKGLFSYFQDWLSGWDEKVDPATEKHESKESTVRTAIFIGLAFAIGVLAEDISSMTEKVDGPARMAAYIIRWPPELVNRYGRSPKDESRIATLLGTKCEPESLAYDLARTHTFARADPKDGANVDAWIIEGNRSNVCQKTTADSIIRLYYFAKNKAFENSNYYDDMKQIQIRLEFLRSLSLIALLWLVSVIIVCAGTIAKPPEHEESKDGRTNKIRKAKLVILWQGIFVLLGVFFLSFLISWANAREQGEFNKRAFGYLSTMRLSDVEKREQEIEKLKLQTK